MGVLFRNAEAIITGIIMRTCRQAGKGGTAGGVGRVLLLQKRGGGGRLMGWAGAAAAGRVLLRPRLC